MKIALCRPPGQNLASSSCQSAENLRLRMSWCYSCGISLLQHDFYKNYFKSCKDWKVSWNFHQLSPREQNYSISYGILGVWGSGNVKILNLSNIHNLLQKSAFHQRIIFSLSHFSSFSEVTVRIWVESFDTEWRNHPCAPFPLTLWTSVKIKKVM